MRSPSPKPAKTSTSTTLNSKKRKCETLEPTEKPSRPTKSCRVARSHQQGVGPPSGLEALPSELQHEIYQNLFQGIKDEVEKEPTRSTPAWDSNPAVKLEDNDTPRLSNVTSILRVSKKTNSEAAQAFYDTVIRPVRVPILR